MSEILTLSHKIAEYISGGLTPKEAVQATLEYARREAQRKLSEPPTLNDDIAMHLSKGLSPAEAVRAALESRPSIQREFHYI
jgi:uncharacterized Ntn-hydrolase superfamily protein